MATQGSVKRASQATPATALRERGFWFTTSLLVAFFAHSNTDQTIGC
jgi:hypothetical protein